MPSRQTNLHRRRRRGVPGSLVAILMIIALLFGGVMGYIIRDRFAPNADPQTTAPSPAPETPAPTEDGEPVDPLSADEAAALLSGDDATAPLSDEPLPADKDAANELLSVPQEPVVVAEYEGGTVMSNEVVDAYNEIAAAYLTAGFSVADYASDLLDQVLRDVVSERISSQKAQEMGLTELNAEDEAAIDAEAQAEFNVAVEEAMAELEQGDMSEQELRSAAIQHLSEDYGLSLDSLREMIRDSWWSEKLYAAVTADVELTPEHLQQAYDELLGSQKSFADFPDDYEYERLNGETIAYNPAGYRTIKHIFLSLESESFDRCIALSDERALLNEETDSARIAEIDEELNALYQPLEARAQEILARLNAGESFDALLDEFGEDELMQQEPSASSGFYVCENSVLWSDEFISAAMALEKPGDISQPVRSLSGVHLICYIAEVPAGPVPLEDIRAALEETTLELLREEAYDAQIDTWFEEAGVVYYPERLQ